MPEFFCLPGVQGFAIITDNKSCISFTRIASILESGQSDSGNISNVIFVVPEISYHQNDLREAVLTVYPTTDCNLRCTYCYASSGSIRKELSLSIYEQFLTDTVDPSRFNQMVLNFHGGGEPTLNPVHFGSLISTFEQKCQALMIKPSYRLTTNGTFSCQVRKLIQHYRIATNVSWDGPDDIQHFQRPFASGKNSHELVLENMRFLIDLGLLDEVRVTITPNNIARLKEIIAFLSHEGIKKIHIEPASILGRNEGEEGLSINYYAAVFKDAYILCCRLGILLRGLGTMIFKKPTQRHCGAFGWNFVLTSSGDISACTRVQHSSDQHSESFLFGPWSPGADPTTFAKPKRMRLQERRTENLEDCAHCFLKYHCAGGCPMSLPESYDKNLVRINEKPCQLIQTCTLKVLEAVKAGHLPPGWKATANH